jgi:hypothetical protein
MKFNFRKVASVIASAVMLGSSIGMAAAANYPAPFIQAGSGTVGVVVGGDLDWAAAFDLGVSLQEELAKQTASSSGTVEAAACVSDSTCASLNSGSNLLYLNDELNENVQTVTKDDLKNVLADGTFTDDDGTDYDYEQSLIVGTDATDTVAFGTSSGDLDDPALMVTLGNTAAKSIYNLTVTFDDAVNFSHSDSEGESLTLFGKTYTVSTDTDADTLVLLGGAEEKTVNLAATETFTIGTTAYTVGLVGITDATTPKATVTVNGASASFTEGQSKKVGGVDVFVKEVNRYSETAGNVKVQLGSGKLTFENGNAVQEGSDNTDIDVTNVVITGTVGAMTKMVIQVAAPDTDVDYLLPGTSFTDPVFGSLRLDFLRMVNGPALSGHTDNSTARGTVRITSAGDRELNLVVTDKSGVTKTLPFAYQNVTQDDNSKAIHLFEGDAIGDEEYFILNSGDQEMFMQMKKVPAAAGATDDCEFKDVFSGETYKIENKDFTGGQTITIGGQTYTVTNVSSTTVRVVSSDWARAGGGNIAVYPYLSLVSGMEQKVAITDTVNITNIGNQTDLELPSGTITLTYHNTSLGGSVNSETAGTVDYNVVVEPVDATTANVVIDVDADQDASNDRNVGATALLFVEDEDKAESTTVDNAVVLASTDSSTVSYMLTPVFTATNTDNSAFDDSDFTGYIDTFGTYVLKDASDTDGKVIETLTYPKAQMYADVYLVESSVTIIPGSAGTGGTVAGLGYVAVADDSYSQVSSKNVIVLGGTCVNSVAAKLLTNNTAKCGADWTTATGAGAGEWIIQSFNNPDASGKVALVVAGWDRADTKNAVTYLITQKPDTTVGKKLKGTTASTATVVA